MRWLLAWALVALAPVTAAGGPSALSMDLQVSRAGSVTGNGTLAARTEAVYSDFVWKDLGLELDTTNATFSIDNYPTEYFVAGGAPGPEQQSVPVGRNDHRALAREIVSGQIRLGAIRDVHFARLDAR